MTPKRKKILMVIDNFDPGGAQTLLLDLVRCLDRRKFEIIIVSLRKPRAHVDALADSGATVVVLRGGKYNPLKLVSLVRLIRKERVEVVHTHLMGSRLLGVIAGRLGGAKKIFSHDHSGDEYLRRKNRLARRLIYPLDRLLMRFTDRILAVSKSVAEFNVNYKQIPGEKVLVINNWIDVDRFFPQSNHRGDFRQRWQIPEQAFVVGSVGRLSRQKGHCHLVEAASRILPKYPETIFVVVGEGEERAALVRLAQDLGVAQAFRLPGFIAEMERVYPVFDLFVLPSLYEPFGLVVLEAMAAGLPVVASATGGVVEIIEDRGNGLLVPPGDAAALAKGILYLLEHRDSVAESMAEQARRLVRTRFDRKGAIDRIEALYLETNA